MPFQVVAFDPGGTTGWSVIDVHTDALLSPDYPILANINFWQAGQYEGSLNDQAQEMVDLCRAWEDADIVCEGFIMRQFLPEPSVLDPVRLAAILSYVMSPRRVYQQQPSLAMTTVTDDRLKDWKLYGDERLTGKPHARDAMRHAITWLRRRKAALAKSRAAANGRGAIQI